MDTIDFVFCSNFNPDDDGWSSEEAPVDLPAPEPPTSGPARAPVKAMGRRRDSRSKSPGAASARAHEDRTRAESVESDDAGPWEAAAPDAAAAAPMRTMAGDDDEDSAEREAPDDEDEGGRRPAEGLCKTPRRVEADGLDAPASEVFGSARRRARREEALDFSDYGALDFSDYGDDGGLDGTRRGGRVPTSGRPRAASFMCLAVLDDAVSAERRSSSRPLEARDPAHSNERR